jgi:hypothetical protein
MRRVPGIRAGDPGAFVNPALKSGWSRNYPETGPFGSRSDLR